MADERKLVSFRDLPATLDGAPSPKRNSAEVHKFAQFANCSVDLASKIVESKDGKFIRAVMDGMVPELVKYISSQVSPLLARIADLERKLAANMKTVREAAQTRDEWEAMFRGSQTLTKTIKTRRDDEGRLVADVFEGSGASIKYRGVWSQETEYRPGDFTTHAGSMWSCLASTRSRPGSDNSWQLAVKKGRDGKDAK